MYKPWLTDRIEQIKIVQSWIHSTLSFEIWFQSKDVTFRGHGDSVDQLCWHPKHPDQLVTASGDKTIRLWDARTNKSVATVNTKGFSKIIGLFTLMCYIFY